MSDIHVISFIDKYHFNCLKSHPEVNLDNIVKGYFQTITQAMLYDGQAPQQTIGNFIKISYIKHNGLSNDGYFFVECLVDDIHGMPSQFLNYNQEFEVIFNGKRYEYKDLKQLYIDYINYETANTIDSLP